MIEVIKKGARARGTRVYIGRPSILGNPFVMGRDGNREEVIRKYHEYLRAEWRRGGAVREELEKLAARVRDHESLSLECWCAPLACHGDVVRRAVLAVAGLVP